VEPPIRVVIVEDNDVFRETLEVLLALRPDIEVTAALADGERAVDACRDLQPDVVLVDYRLPGLDGVQTTAALREACPAASVVCLSAEAEPREREAFFEAGAVASLIKDQPLDEIVDTIRRAARLAPAE
jgi:two-component system response regulator DesR